MADAITSTGITIKTVDELITDLENGLKSIYGNDINLDPNSPDGQLVNLIAQLGVDLRELIVECFNSYNPELAQGTILDQRVVINNIMRAGATYTIQPISITVDRTVTLQGLDGDYNNPDGVGFTVQDNAGNQFILVDTVTLTAGTYSINFRAKEIGEVLTTQNTITTQSTIVLGVTAINNPLSALNIGTNEETDANLKIRRSNSVALASQGQLNGLLGAILALDGVTEAQVYDNPEDTVDADGIPAHGVWLIVEGGSSSDITEVMSEKVTMGCNTKGSVSDTITTDNGFEQTFNFDRPTAEALHIKFNIQKTISTASFDQASIKQYIVDNKTYGIGAFAETSELTALSLEAINSLGGGGVPTQLQISKNGSSWFDYLTTTTKDRQFTMSTANITITVL